MIGPVTPRLVAVDMDGTLLNSSGTYDRRRFERLHARLVDAGVRFVVASGNQYWLLRGFFEGVPDVLYIAENGAVVATDSEVLRSEALPSAAVAASLAVLDPLPGVLTALCGVDAAYTLSSADPGQVEIMRHHYARFELVDRWADVRGDIVKVALHCGPRVSAPAVLDSLRDRLGEDLVAVTSGHEFIDLIAPGRTKGAALAWLGDRLGIAPADMVAFGDSHNDLEMLDLVGLGVVMANAHDVIKTHADDLADANDASGVLTYLERLLDAPRAAG